MIYECLYCESQVNGTVIGEHKDFIGDDIPQKLTFLKCPVCHCASLVLQEMWQGFSPIGEVKTGWDDPVRIWPSNDLTDWRLPVKIRISLDEASRCFKAKAFNACAVMCGRTLEVMCSELGVKDNLLAGGLKELLQKEIIDKKIYLWGEALRKKRNIGAHAAEENVNKTDAEDVLDFTKAICQNVFILDKQFVDFMKRQRSN